MRRALSAVAALVGVGRRSELTATLVVGLVLAVAVAVLVAQPRLLRAAETESLEQALAATPAQRLGLSLEVPDLFEVGVGGAAARRDRKRAALALRTFGASPPRRGGGGSLRLFAVDLSADRASPGARPASRRERRRNRTVGRPAMGGRT